MTRARLQSEDGMTLVELLVAASMSVVLVGAACAMLISAVQSQPKLSERAQAISTARYVLERMTREIRNGSEVYPGATGSLVAFKARVRRTACGATVQESPGTPAIECRVTYECGPASVGGPYACERRETAPEVATGGTPTRLVSGLASDTVFSYESGQGGCTEEPVFVGVNLQIPNPERTSGADTGNLTVSDGAGLRIKTYTC